MVPEGAEIRPVTKFSTPLERLWGQNSLIIRENTGNVEHSRHFCCFAWSEKSAFPHAFFCKFPTQRIREFCSGIREVKFPDRLPITYTSCQTNPLIPIHKRSTTLPSQPKPSLL